MLHDYLHLLSDPAHMAVEFTFVLIDVLAIRYVERRWRGWVAALRTALHAAPATQPAPAA